MRFWFQRDEDAPRPPVAGRLIGVAVGVFLLSLAIYVALGVIAELIPIVVPLLGVIGIYLVMFRRHHK